MKTTIVSVGVFAAAALAQGQSVDTLSDCGKICINNMRSQAQSLGCKTDDWSCLCTNPNFSYGIHDCSVQACPSDQDALAAQSFGYSMCQAHGIAVTSVGGDGAASGTQTVSVAPKPSGGVMPSGPAIAVTSSFTTLITSGNTVVTSTGAIVLTGVVSPSPTRASPKPKVTDDSAGNEGDEPTNTADSNSETGSETGSETSDPAIRATAAPLGFLAAAGVAAMLL